MSECSALLERLEHAVVLEPFGELFESVHTGHIPARIVQSLLDGHVLAEGGKGRGFLFPAAIVPGPGTPVADDEGVA